MICPTKRECWVKSANHGPNSTDKAHGRHLNTNAESTLNAIKKLIQYVTAAKSVNMSYKSTKENITHRTRSSITNSSPGGIWILAGSCGEAGCGSRGVTATVCGAAGLGTVIITVLPGVVTWFMEATWLKTAFVTCGCPLALTPPEAATFAITTTEGEEVCSPGTVIVEEVGWWL